MTEAGDVDGRHVVLAIDPWTAPRLVPSLGEPPAAKGVTTYYHAAEPWGGQSAALVVDAVPWVAGGQQRGDDRGRAVVLR